MNPFCVTPSSLLENKIMLKIEAENKLNTPPKPLDQPIIFFFTLSFLKKLLEPIGCFLKKLEKKIPIKAITKGKINPV